MNDLPEDIDDLTDEVAAEFEPVLRAIYGKDKVALQKHNLREALLKFQAGKRTLEQTVSFFFMVIHSVGMEASLSGIDLGMVLGEHAPPSKN